MKGNEQVIGVLNQVLRKELTGINQYFIHAKMCENWGYHRLAAVHRKESIEEMKHADELIERILYLDGVPNMQRLGKVRVGETVPEQLKLDYKLEQEAIPRLNQAIALATEVADNGSRHLLEDILRSEEDHVNWIEAQFAQIQQMGEAHYLAQQVKKADG